MGIFERFGLSLKKPHDVDEKKNQKSFVQPTPDDGSLVVEGVGSFGMTSFDISGQLRSEIDLINKYREMENQPEVNRAIDDIVNESIVIDEDAPIVKLNLDRIEASSSLKEVICDEFDKCLRLLDFRKQGYEIFRRFYVDGRLHFHAVIDEKKPRDGIQEVRFIDPRQIKRIVETDTFKDPKTGVEYEVIKDEYWVYSRRNLRDTRRGNFANSFFPVHTMNQGNNANVHGIKIHPDSIIYVHSGKVNENNSMVLSHLHSAIKVFNQLRMMEDAVVIYRLTRAPERRIFYVDTGGLPGQKGQQYLRSVMEKYNNRLLYDAQSGEIRDDRRYLAMTEDFWIPRNGDGDGTEIDTLPGGQNLDAIEDVVFFQKKLYDALNVPKSRLDSGGGFNMGRSSEISNEEIRFNKFIKRLRSRFSGLFDSLLEKQLILKNIVSEDDWKIIKEDIKYEFNTDSYFTLIKDFEILTQKIEMIDSMESHVGTYFSREYIQRNILGMDTEEIKNMHKQIENELKTGKIINNVDNVEDSDEDF